MSTFSVNQIVRQLEIPTSFDLPVPSYFHNQTIFNSSAVLVLFTQAGGLYLYWTVDDFIKNVIWLSSLSS